MSLLQIFFLINIAILAVLPIVKTGIEDLTGGQISAPELKRMIRNAVVSAGVPSNMQSKLMQKLYEEVTHIHRGEELFILSEQINALAHLSHGMSCNPLKQIIINDPPIAYGSELLQDHRIDMIIAWQEALLRIDEPMCNFKLNLECSRATFTCQCKSSEMNKSHGTTRCELLVGQNCNSDYDITFYYDPLRNFTSLTKSIPPTCTQNSSCIQKQFFHQSKCWCDPNKACRSSLKITPKDLQVTLHRNAIIADNLVLNLHRQCDPFYHQELLNPFSGDQSTTEDRLNILSTLSDFDIYFCNVRLHLNCTEDTKICKCWRFLSFEKGHCRITNLLPCQEDFQRLPFYKNGASVGDVAKTLHFPPFRPSCIESAACHRSKAGHFQCQCIDPTQAGAFCNETKSSLTSLLEKIWNFPIDDDNLAVFHKFNQYFLTIEMRMTLTYENTCYAKGYGQFSSLFAFIFNIFQWPTPQLKIAEFKDALKWAEAVGKSNILLCNGFKGLACIPIEHRCRCMRGLHWDVHASKCTLDSGAHCQFHPISSSYWDFKCPTNSACDGKQLSYKTCQCVGAYDGYNCQQRPFFVPTTLKVMRKLPDAPTESSFSFFKSLEEQGIRKPRLSTKEDLSFESEFEFSKSLGRALKPQPFHRQLLPGSYHQHHRQLLPWPASTTGHKSPYETTEEIIYIRWPNESGGKLTTLASPDDGHQLPGSPSKGIMDSMVLPYNATCDPSYDNPGIQSKILETSTLDLDRKMIKHFLEEQLERQTIDKPRCNYFWYLECDNVTMSCQCNVTFDLQPGDDGRCYIKTNDFCLSNDSLLNETFGVISGQQREPPNCNKGHICDRTRYNLYRCRPFLRDEIPVNDKGAVILKSCLVFLGMFASISV